MKKAQNDLEEAKADLLGSEGASPQPEHANPPEASADERLLASLVATEEALIAALSRPGAPASVIIAAAVGDRVQVHSSATGEQVAILSGFIARGVRIQQLEAELAQLRGL